LVTAAVLGPASALATTDVRPDSQTQPLADGCQRNPAGLLTFTSPEWVYVYKESEPRVVEGTAVSTHTAGGDLPEGHDSYDLNSNINVDPAYAYLLATGNFAGNGEETGRLHVEWETGTVPTFVWPTENDRVKLWGSWIWDCGHWGQSTRDPDYFLPGSGETPGSTNVPGERTEFHPMRAMVVTRGNPYQPTTTETESDVFISSDGTIAHAEEQCALEHPPPPGASSYGPDYSACMQDTSKRRQPVNDRDYTFFVPAPPKPSATATLRWRVVSRISGGPPENVQVQPNGISVTVPFAGFGSNTAALAYGKSFFVGWSQDPTPPTHLVVKFQELRVIHSLDPNPDRGTQTGTPPGEYNLYADVNGYWQFLNNWAPGLGAVSDGQLFDLGRKVDIYVPAGKGLRLFVHGRECDLPKINPCPNTSELSDDNDLPGDATATFPSVTAALGKHTLTAPSGNYSLSYSIAQAR
jgi:hypothetical protein